jgi:NAD(P)H-quinone oxidoreductase subunit 5
MHAGIVNAGGYLIIRTSPLVSLTPWALTLLALIGGFTACFAAVAMMTQTSIKKKLAYSTIAQMGFMLLQCGLGAYSAAMLHILAHSLYKAYAFLSSGSVMTLRAATSGAHELAKKTPWLQISAVGVTAILFLALAFRLCGIDPVQKPGGMLLGALLCLALMHWVGQVIRTGSRPLLVRAMAVSATLCFAYAVAFLSVDWIIAESLPAPGAPELAWLVNSVIVVGFVGVFFLQTQLTAAIRSPWLGRLYIHWSNGFYVENSLRRMYGALSRA